MGKSWLYNTLLYGALWPYLAILTIARHLPVSLGRMVAPTKWPDVRAFLVCWPLTLVQLVQAVVFLPLLVYDFNTYKAEIGEKEKDLSDNPEGGVQHGVPAWLYTLYVEHPLFKPDLHHPDHTLLIAAVQSPSFLKRDLPPRQGGRPAVIAGLPHRQVTQLAAKEETVALDRAIFEHIYGKVRGLKAGQSMLEGTGSPALQFEDPKCCRDELQKLKLEFLHRHSLDSSWHVLLSPRDAIAVLQAQWGERGPPIVAQGIGPPGLVLLYAPRDKHEREVFLEIVDAGYQYSVSQKTTQEHSQ